MDFLIAAHSDVGIKKKTNQDSFLVKVAQTKLGKVCLCVVCDGIGGLSKGELASTAVVRVFNRWFEEDFPDMLRNGFDPDELRLSWDNIVLEQNQVLASYASRHGTRMGTTVLVLLIIDNQYFIMNVGDSRVYLLNQQIKSLTKDQTYVQYEVDLGHLTLEQAWNHPQSNVLLQCVGASEVVTPDYYCGRVEPETIFVMCSDGFRHVISPDEIYGALAPQTARDELTMKNNAVMLTELNKQRMEVDNISVVVIRICQEG